MDKLETETSEQIETRQSGRKWATLLGVCLAAVMLPLGITVAGVALGSIGNDLHASFAQLEWVNNAYTLTFTALLLTAGSLADLYGRRRMFATGLIIFTIGSLLSAFSPVALMLNLSRAVQGIGAAFVLSSGPALLADGFRDSERAKAFGLLGAAFGVGIALGPLVGGALVSGLGWRWAFLINVPLGLGALVFAAKMRESRAKVAAHLDWAGFITFTLGLSLFTYALIAGPDAGWGSPLVLTAILGAGVLMILFVLAEKRQHCPMFDLTLFQKPTFVAASLIVVAVSFCLVALLTYLPLYFQTVNGFSALKSGLTILPLTILLFVVPTVTGKLTAHFSARILVSAGLILIGVGTLWMRAFHAGGNWMALLGGLVIAGIGVGINTGLLDNLAISAAPIEQSGSASGMFNTMRIVGDTLGIAGAGAILISAVSQQLFTKTRGIITVTDGQIAQLANRVARGDIAGAAASIPAPEHELFVRAANQSYADALNTVLFVLASVGFAGAVLTLFLVRARDRARLAK